MSQYSMTSLQFVPPVIAHRGASGYAPENTLISFTKAAQMGIKWVEFDVMLSADNVPIIFHDTKLKRTTNGKGKVGTHEYAYLSTLDAGAWFDHTYAGERIPTLDEMMTFLIDHQICANVEIKPLAGQEETTVDYAVDVISKYFTSNSPSILYSSFSLPSLKYLRSVLPDCNMGLLIHSWWRNWQRNCEELQCATLNINERILTKEKVAKIKSNGATLLSYTVNDPQRAGELYSWGVDALFSDYPDKILKENVF